jgi:hypothetical protein
VLRYAGFVVHLVDKTQSILILEICYGADKAEHIVRYFLKNAKTWRGPVAKRIKAALRAAYTTSNPRLRGKILPPEDAEDKARLLSSLMPSLMRETTPGLARLTSS